jgi:release factor glutamine methyltransferase
MTNLLDSPTTNLTVSETKIKVRLPRRIFRKLVHFASPPSFAGEPLSMADRAWHAGPDYRDIAPLFTQARQRITKDGKMYLLLSSDSDIAFLSNLIKQAGFVSKIVARHSIWVESFSLYELTVGG